MVAAVSFGAFISGRLNAHADDSSSHTFVIFDRNGNFIENKNLSNEYDDWTGDQLKEELRQEGFITDSKSNIDNYYNSPFTDVYVIAPKHILTLNYVDQNGKTVYVEKHAVTNYGQTDVQKNLSDNYTVDNDQKSVNNSNTNYTVKVTAKDGVNDSFQQKENDIFSDTPAVNEVSSSNDLSTQSGNSYTYNANITIQDQTGKRLGSYVLSNEDSNIVSFDGIIENYYKDYDTSGLPKYVDLTQGNQIFTVNSHNVDEDNKPIGNNDKVVFKIIDQHGNFVEYLTFNTYGKKLKTIELADRLKQEKMILHNNPALSNEYVPDGTYNMDVNVIAPYQIDKVNYINQDNQLIFSSYHLASSKDFKIDVINDLYRMPSGTILDLDDNNYIDNKPEQNVYVTEDLKQTPYQKMSDLTLNYDNFSQVNPVSIDNLDSDDTSGITYLGYSAIIILKNQYGKIVRADRIDGYQWNLVKFDYLSDENKADYDISSLPEYIDLSLGMQTFVIKSLKPDNTTTDINKVNSKSTVKKVGNKPDKRKLVGSQKPTRLQLKSLISAINADKKSVKSDTAKLKTLKKKMKKHATKKQKAAYKKLQTKLSAEKKAFNSVKTQEGKLFKYFKSVSTINHESKQIKSLTAQIKKLKKKHSKTSKKLYKKDLKALKKANKTLKAATKFVKNYK